MTDYVKITDYAAKDALATGNPVKAVTGTALGADFDALATSSATKADKNMAVAFSLADGAVGAPGLAFVADTNTGLYRIGADHLALTTGGVKAVDVDSTGTVLTRAAVAPLTDNTSSIGTATNAWSQGYFGAAHLALFDSTYAILGSQARTAAEVAAGVTPTSYAFPADPNIDPRRYHVLGTIGTQADDLASVNSAILVLKAVGNGAQIIVPGSYSATMTMPALALANGQSGTIVDMRQSQTTPFGAITMTIEGKAAGGGYASELNVRGKQNPAFVLQTYSDGTALGYTIANHGASFVARTNAGGNNFQLLVDPYFLGYRGDFSLITYPSGTFSEACYIGADANNKNRWNFQTNRLNTAVINISSVTNTTPIVVNTSTPVNIQNGIYTGCTIAGVGAGVNGSWKAQVTGASQLTLLNSVASGAFGAVGTATVFTNMMRATLNVPTTQGGTEAIVSEGSNVIASTTAGVGFIFNDLTSTQIGGLSYNTGPVGMRGTSIVGISQSTSVANNLAGTATFAAATTKVVAFANNETNANYRVVITFTADAGAQAKAPWVTAKGTTGFTVNVASATSATFDWMIIRD